MASRFVGYLLPVRTELVDSLADAFVARRLRVAVAESLTCGRIASALGAGHDAADWLAGGVVAYSPDVKFELLGVEPGPVITAACARELAEGVERLLRADVAVGVTGCGGPEPEEGQPPGTVFIAVRLEARTIERAYEFDGGPEAVLDQTVESALRLVVEALDGEAIGT
jgi:nicotinamide-nucleotide amidase